MDEDKKSVADRDSRSASNAPPEAIDEFFNQLQSDMRRPDISQEAVAAAFEAIQQMGMDAGAEQPSQAGSVAACPGCGTSNPGEHRFCGACGMALAPAAPSTGETLNPAGQHHYHHHYHHHIFPGGGRSVSSAGQDTRPVASLAAGRDAARLRAPAGGGLSRAEIAVRKVAQDWALACNTKHLDDMVSLYAPDAIVIRPNVPLVRGTATIREYLFSILEAGLGEVEIEPMRTEIFGDLAYEAGRCKMLVPVVTGKRREERGKYLVILNRQEGEWKLVADSWSSDLSLTAGAESPAPGSNAAIRAPRKP